MGTDGSLQKTISNDWAQYILSQETEFSEGLTFIRFNEYSDPVGSFFSNVEKDNYLVYNDFILYYGAYYNVTGELVIDFLIIENTGLMGVPWPPIVKNAFEVLKKKGGAKLAGFNEGETL